MPILDPLIQLSLSNQFKNRQDEKIEQRFFLELLRLSSKKIYQNRKMFEASKRLTKKFTKYITLVNKILECKISTKDIESKVKNNIYTFIAENITSNELYYKEHIGDYYNCTDQYQTKLFQPAIFENGSYTWFLSNTPIAILCIRNKISDDSTFVKIQFEVDLFYAAGYTLVLCVLDHDAENLEFYKQLIAENNFSEIHINCNNFFQKHLQNNYNFDEFKQYKGYFYLYTHFIDRKNAKLHSIQKKFKQLLRVNIISFAGENFINKDENIKLIETKPFAYCLRDSDFNYLSVRLSNISLYDSENDISSNRTSGIGIGYIYQKDFSNSIKLRIKIIFDNNTNTSKEQYINFEDVHLIRPDLYTNDQLTLAKIDAKTLKKVTKIEKRINRKIDNRVNKKFKKKWILSLIKENKFQECFEYAAYAYSYSKSTMNHTFYPHRTQIYTAYEACRRFIFQQEDPKQKGIVFQVATGEGKTCIVCLIASALALMKKTVHITSSNIKLSIRDFEESYSFFKLFNIKTAVLIHDNELPSSVRQKFKSESQIKEQEERNKKEDDRDQLKKDEKNDNDNEFAQNRSEKDEEEDKKYEEEDKEYEEEDKKDEENEKDEVDSFFGSKSDSYFKLHSQNTRSNLDKYYDRKYYDPKLFQNSSRMNFSVCGIDDKGEKSSNKAQVIFSTFVNFEYFYLKMIELCPGSIEEKFKEYGLLIDEADSILIDEISNGTIISRSMNSNAIEVLKFVYEQYKSICVDQNQKEDSIQEKEQPYEIIFKRIQDKIQEKKEWHICANLITKKHVKQMCEEIDLVHETDYKNGKKYSIVEFEVKNKKKMNHIIKNVLNFAKDVTLDFTKGFIEEFTKDPETKDDEDDEDDSDDSDDSDDDDDNDEDKNPSVTFRRIVPFGYDRNGILEPNKEFGGFIQQFIAIKESIDNKVENMIVNDISMSYLYISHPIFIKLYGTVCGFTGTIGSSHDKQIYREKYSLRTLKIPRYNANLNVQLPMILCENKEEWKKIIISEIVEFHQRGNPVLAIFQDLTEIDEIEYQLNLQGIKNINIFNGINEMIKADYIAGIKGSITLGTNVCGRGTNIIAKGPPLHVIVSYYSSNVRVMEQAFGRTARQGRKGTYRIICIKTQYFKPVNVLKNADALLTEFSIKSHHQQKFVQHFEVNRPWIFSGFPGKQVIDSSTLKELRSTKININRIIASNFVFPICMTKDVFLKIQEQRIFSLFNCPNCKFTWRLFQRYLRELILETWSLLINEVDQEFKDKEKGKEYDEVIKQRMNELFTLFDEQYLPNKKEEILPTFMFIFKKVRKTYEHDILKNFIDIANPLLEFNPTAFFECKVGFRPYTLLTGSGSRITSKNGNKTNFIKDPELIFEKKTVKKKYQIISITEKIDDLFERIFQKVNEILGSIAFIKLFLRRTLGGCEFGFCLTLDIENQKEDPFCIIDIDPLLTFTIFVRSLAPVLAIILISALIYLSVIAVKISKWFSAPGGIATIAKKTAKIALNALATNFLDKIYDKILEFLECNLNNNIDQLSKSGEEANARIIEILKGIFDSSDARDVTNKLSNFLGKRFKIKSRLGNIGEFLLQPVQLMRISGYLLLLLASFVMNYRHKKQRLRDYTNESKEYNDNPNEKTLNKLFKKHEKNVKMDDIQSISVKKKKEIEESYEKQSKTYLYKMTFCDTIEKFINRPSTTIDKKKLIQKGITLLAKNIYLNNHNCIRISYPGNEVIFDQQIRFYLTNKYPSIIPFVGYYYENKIQHIFIEYKSNGTLKDFIESNEKKIDLTHKLIIAYGIACAMNYLHGHDIIHRNLKPSNIYLDSNLYPYLSNFYRARQTKIQFPYQLKKMTLRYEPPEFITNYIENQNSFRLDIYSYGMVLYYLITETRPFSTFEGSRNELIESIQKGYRPEFPITFPKEYNKWKKLINKCWEQLPFKRPIFGNIIAELESEFVHDKNIDQEIFNDYKNNVLKIKEPELTID